MILVQAYTVLDYGYLNCTKAHLVLAESYLGCANAYTVLDYGYSVYLFLNFILRWLCIVLNWHRVL